MASYSIIQFPGHFYVLHTRILNKLSDLQVKERCQYIASFGKVDLLIIDDLGVERNSEFALEQVYAVIDERCE
ncbi:MAG: ATP-binding protein [Oscillospiraceae bacterium]|nr:ATP-binding protein [Oscillospiraceae bacterium]